MSRIHSPSLRVAVTSSLLAGVAWLALAAPAGAEPGIARIQPMPKAIGSTKVSGYVAISCPTPTSCTAVGAYQSGGLPTAVTESKGVWGKPVELVPPFGGLASGRVPTLEGVSCPAAGFCEAVGVYAPANGNGVLPMLFTESSGTWSAAASLPGPSNMQSGNNELFEPTGITCISTDNCVVVGAYGGTDGTIHQFADTQSSGGAYTSVQLPDIAGNSLAVVESVSCTALTHCSAVGEELNTSTFSFETAAWNEVSGTWASPSVVPTAGRVDNFVATSVACPDATTCLAVGSEVGLSFGTGVFDNAAFAVETSGVWSKATRLQSPLLYPYSTSGVLTSIACGSTTRCEAVGLFGTAAAAATWSHGKWSSFDYVRAPAGGRLATHAALLAVSCPSIAPCTSVGIAGDSTRKHPSNTIDGFSAIVTPTRSIERPRGPVAVTGYGIAGGIQAEWQPPVSDGGSPVRSFTARVEPGGATCTTTHVACALRGLRNGHRYRVIVSDRTSFGASHATEGHLVLAGAAPSQPKDVQVALQGNQLIVSWQRSASPPGEPEHYTVRVQGPLGFSAVVGTRSDSASIAVKTTGTYKVQLTASNKSGSSKTTTISFTPVIPLPARVVVSTGQMHREGLLAGIHRREMSRSVQWAFGLRSAFEWILQSAHTR